MASVPNQRPKIPPRRPCYGRQDLIDQLMTLVDKPAPNPIPILGGPAIGKSTLGIEFLHDPRIAEKFDSRRFFVDCDGAGSRDALIAKIAQAVGVAKAPYPEDAVLTTLEVGPTILILDDGHTPIESDGDEVLDLLSRMAAIADLALLVIMRGGQRSVQLAWEEPIHVLPLAPQGAREAFLSASASHHENDSYLDQLLQATGHVPSAVVLLGALAQTEPSLKRLSKRWEKERIKILEGPGVSKQFEKLEASFELSIRAPHMDKACRTLLSALAALPDGIDPDEVNEVFPNITDVACDSLRHLALVLPEERLRLHALLREYVSDRYPLHEGAWRHAVKYYTQLAVREEGRFGTKASDEAISRFAANLENIETVIRHALDGFQETLALEAAAALAGYIFLTGDGSRDLVEAALERQGSMSSEAQARLLKNCADFEKRHGDRKRAYRMYEAAYEHFKDVNDMSGAADCIKKIGDLDREAEKWEDAAVAYRSALDIQQELEDLIGQAGCVAGLADIAVAQGDQPNAHDGFRQAFNLYSAAKNHAGMAYCKMRLGYALFSQGEFEEAREEFKTAIEMAGKAHDLLVEASALQGLGMSELKRGRSDLAEPCFAKAFPFFERVDDTFGIAGCLRGLGDAARLRKDNGQAWRRYIDALNIYRRGEHWPDIHVVCMHLVAIADKDDERRYYEAKAEEAEEKMQEASQI